MKHLLCHTKAQMLWISALRKVSRHTFLIAVLVSWDSLLPSICVWVSPSQRERVQEDICFMSAGSVALGFEVIGLPLSARGQNMDLSFLKESLQTSAPTAWEGAMVRGEEGLEGGWRKRKGRNYRKWQCVWSDKPLARTSLPWGRTGGYKTSASMLSPTTVPDDPAQTSRSYVCRQ